ncbi:MAG: hypothetical protein HN368_12915 [Spirochaetales bacterium]|jgi:hypothetical protein|nr:hypothetical protein [Spirochaetales bacterium]
MVELPKISLGPSGAMVTRLISGGNPLCGNSHFSAKMSKQMSDYFTPEQVVAYLHALQANGINALQARGDYHRILYWLELFCREGGNLQWIAQTASEMSDVFQNIRILAAADSAGIYHHGTSTDRFWQEGRVDKVNDYLKCIRDSGVQVGLGTHIPEVIEYAEEKDWDIDFYMACFYNLSRKPRESALVSGKAPVSQEEFRAGDPERMCRVIRQTEKTCLAFKILGASRLCATQEDVAAAFHFAFSQIKPKDAVVVGMFPKDVDQIALNVQHTIAGTTPRMM